MVENVNACRAPDGVVIESKCRRRADKLPFLSASHYYTKFRLPCRITAGKQNAPLAPSSISTTIYASTVACDEAIPPSKRTAAGAKHSRRWSSMYEAGPIR
jgi:hypothetical protein